MILHVLGLIGFFALAESLYKNPRFSLLATLLLMVSSVGIASTQNPKLIYFLAPSIWLFFFLISFLKHPRKKHLFGVSLTLPLSLNSPFPFHFLTILGTSIGCFVFFYRHKLKTILIQGFRFFKKYPWMTALASVSLLLSSFMLYSQHHTMLALSTINASSIAKNMIWLEIFPNLDLATHPLAYVPLFIYILLPLSIINKNAPRQSVLFFTGLFLFLIALTDVTPLHAFLYRFCPLFRMFDQYQIFLPILLIILILFTIEQLKMFLTHKPDGHQEKAFLLFFITSIHLLFGLFLHQQGNIIWSSWATLVGSYTFFMLYFTHCLNSKGFVFMILLITIALIQPVEVNYYYRMP